MGGSSRYDLRVIFRHFTGETKKITKPPRSVQAKFEHRSDCSRYVITLRPRARPGKGGSPEPS